MTLLFQNNKLAVDKVEYTDVKVVTETNNFFTNSILYL